MQFVYEGVTDDNGKMVKHRLTVNVTDLTKVISGVRSLVSFDQDFAGDQLAEAELTFYAQDNSGNVWSMGEHPEEYDSGKFVQAPTWIHGFQDAHAGLAMLASPQAGTPSYSQGWGPAVSWTDRGQVRQTGQKVCVPVKCYDNVLVIAESSKAEPNAYQLKYFAPGVGGIRTDWLGSDVTQEKLELVKVTQLSPDELTKVREAALNLEKHAYEVSKDVYAKTPPSEVPEGAPTQATSAPAAPAGALAGTAVATDTAGGNASVAKEVLDIEANIEDAMDALGGNNWAGAHDDIAKMGESWTAYQQHASKDGALQGTLDAFAKTFGQLKSAADAKNVATSLQAANDLSGVVMDLYDVYHPAAPTDIGRLDVLERQVNLDVKGKDFAAAAKTLGAINTTWQKVKPAILSHNAAQGKDVAGRYEASIAAQSELVKKQDASGLQDEATKSLDIVDALEKLF